MIFKKAITNYRIRKQRGFFTIERKYVHFIFGIAYKTEWKPATEFRHSKHIGALVEQPLHFSSERTARDFVKREVATLKKKPTL